MNKNFIIIDKNNNIQKQAASVVKFNLEGKDYLVYCVDENAENKQIFVSRFILNSEGKCFIDNIVPEEKSKLSEIVYNIIILAPTSYKKGEDPQKLLNNLSEKYKVSLTIDIPELGEQEYYNSCSIAITSKELVNLAEEFFAKTLKVEQVVNEPVVNSMPTWEIPSLDTNTISNTSEVENNAPTVDLSAINQSANQATPVDPIPSINVIPNPEPIPAPSVNAATTVELQTNNINSVQPEVPPVTNNVVQETPATQPTISDNIPNPQAEKLAVVSDPSLASIAGLNPSNVQPNMVKLNNKGKASVKYIVIGTVCILLAIAVVIVAYILIQKKTTGV